MNTVLAVLSLFAVAVSASNTPFYFSSGSHLDPRVVHYHALRLGFDKYDQHDYRGKKTDYVAFVHLVPRLGVDLLEHEFGSSVKVGSDVKVVKHDFLLKEVDLERDVLVDLVAFSDCEDWHATLLTVWRPELGLRHVAHLYAKKKDERGEFKFVKNYDDGLVGPTEVTEEGKKDRELRRFVTFVHDKLEREHLRYLATSDKGLPTHHALVKLVDLYRGLKL